MGLYGVDFGLCHAWERGKHVGFDGWANVGVG